MRAVRLTGYGGVDKLELGEQGANGKVVL